MKFMSSFQCLVGGNAVQFPASSSSSSSVSPTTPSSSLPLIDNKSQKNISNMTKKKKKKKKRDRKVIKVFKPDGVINIYHKPIRVSEVITEEYMVCRSDSFYIGQKVPPLSLHERLQPGHTYFLLPTHIFHSVLSFVTIASFTASSRKPDMDDSNCNTKMKAAFLKKAAASSCSPFDIQKTASGTLRIRVSEIFISQMMMDQAHGKTLVDVEEAADLLCTTPQLHREYKQLVVGSRRGWKPKLEMIKETQSVGKRKVKMLFSASISRMKKKMKKNKNVVVPHISSSSSSSLSPVSSKPQLKKKKKKTKKSVQSPADIFRCAMAAIMPNFGLRQLPLLNKFRSSFPPSPPPSLYLHRSSSSMTLPVAISSDLSSSSNEDSKEPKLNTATLSITIEDPDNRSKNKKGKPFFPKRGETLELVCESLAFKGKGLCKVEETGYVVMCDRALPGERFLGRVTRKKNNYAEVTKLKTLSPHTDIVEAPCEYALHCGGCKTQNLLYEAQVKAKEEQVRDLVVHVGKFSYKDPEFNNMMKPIVPCDMQFHYRNKMEFSFGPKRWLPKEQLQDKSQDSNVYSLGLHAPGFFDKVLNVDKCFLQSEPANKVLAVVQDCWRNSELGLSPYDCHSHDGFMKHLMIRSGRDVNTLLPQIMVNFVTSSYKPDLLKPLVDKLSVFPEVVSIMNNVNTSVGNTSVGEQEYTLYGKSTITEMLRGLSFEISANSFFQTNAHQAEILYKLVQDCAGLKGDGSEIVLDLFCGTGTIGLTLAKKVKHVYGYEVVPEAVSDARRNAKLNGLNNATFIQGDLNKVSESFGNDFPKPDIIISDPNRPGMHNNLIKFLLKLKAPKIVYVSCNPATCARDLDYLCHGSVEQKLNGCYRLKSIQPVDMFPHTPHIECVCLLELR